MVVDIYEIEGTPVAGATLKLKQNRDRSAWNTVGASVQAAFNGATIKVEVSPSTGVHTVLDELVALGNHGRIYVVFCTPTQVAAMVTSTNIPSS